VPALPSLRHLSRPDGDARGGQRDAQHADLREEGERDPKGAHKAVLTVVQRLRAAGALRDTGQTVTNAKGSTPAAVYVAAGADQGADAIAQAEAVLRSLRRPSGGAGGSGAAAPQEEQAA